MVPWIKVCVSRVEFTFRLYVRSDATPLDALIFAYLHTVLHTANHIVRIEVTRRVNLVAWELRVRGLVSAAFTRP